LKVKTTYPQGAWCYKAKVEAFKLSKTLRVRWFLVKNFPQAETGALSLRYT